jgi:tRNA(Leu) C34 or U34 (ribose-2'-O)-methylase TrmL
MEQLSMAQLSMEQAKVKIGLINPKSPMNVASVMRAAGNFRVGGVFYTGQRYARALKFKPDTPNMARKVSESVPLTEVNSLLDAVPAGMKIVCVELAENALPLLAFQHPENAFYIFGPEDSTIGQPLIDRADAVVYVPTVGCLNLSAVVNIVLYDRMLKTMACCAQDFDGNELIRRSRDTNNTVKVNAKNEHPKTC